MPKFNYVAMDTKGKEVSGVLESGQPHDCHQPHS